MQFLINAFLQYGVDNHLAKFIFRVISVNVNDLNKAVIPQ